MRTEFFGSAKMLQPGMPAPEIKAQAYMPNGTYKGVTLADYKGKYLVVLFYPADFTFVCRTEIIAFSDRVEEFRKVGAGIVAISCDSVQCHYSWVNTPLERGGLGKVNIPLLADKNHSVSKAYGVLKVDDGISFRGLFIIDGKSILRRITVNDFRVGRDVDETLRLVQAFQYTDEHGEV